MTRRDEKRLVLDWLADHTWPDGEHCTHFAPIVRGTELQLKRVRYLCRLLKRQGLAEFHKGLWTESGDPAGAGYCVSRAGLNLVLWGDKPETELQISATDGRG